MQKTGSGFRWTGWVRFERAGHHVMYVSGLSLISLIQAQRSNLMISDTDAVLKSEHGRLSALLFSFEEHNEVA
jgi:hypothetical protein